MLQYSMSNRFNSRSTPASKARRATPRPLAAARGSIVEILENRRLLSGYFQTNLAADVPGVAQVHDPELIDAQGIAINPTGTFWVSARATGVSTVYSGDVTQPNGTISPFVKSALTVTIPGGSPTGQVFSGSNDFVVTAPPPAAPISDPQGDLLSTYTGPPDPGLDVVAHKVTLAGDRMIFFGRMAGAVAATQAVGGLYLFGVDRGLGTPRFVGGTPVIGPNVRWDLIVRVNPDGTGLVNNQVAGVVTPLNPSDIVINGNEFTASVPLSLLLPAPAAIRPPAQWTYNLWPRNAVVIGQNQHVSDLAPNDGNSPVQSPTSGPARFIFASETGNITGWNAAVPPPPPARNAFLKASTPGAVYTGLAIANNGSGNFLYAADFENGKIDVFDRTYTPATLAGSFEDPNVPEAYEPINIQNLGGRLYVAYARQDGDGDGLPGKGAGFVSVFDTNGNFLNRVVSGNHLHAPWGMALAPANFGEFSNALLVASTQKGRISAFDPETGSFLGQLRDPAGAPITIDGLWGLDVGNGTVSGDRDALYFSAAPDNHRHGLFGSVRVAPDGPDAEGGSRPPAVDNSAAAPGDLSAEDPRLADDVLGTDGASVLS